MRSSGGLESAVALKVLRDDIDMPSEALTRLRDEARALGHLDHPAIVRAFDILELEGRLALATELIEGDDLDRCIEGSDRLSHRALLQVIAQVADALHAAAQATAADGTALLLVHRDVKPSNIRIGRHGQVKLLDFGIAWFAGDDREARTASEMMVGSLPYMAPERFVERDHHTASDVFSLGCCLFEGLGTDSFYGDGSMRALSALAMNPEAFGAHRLKQLEAIDAGPVRELLARMLHFEPTQRPTARDVSRRCEELADDMKGPSLRLWCTDRTWRDDPGATGSLQGRVLKEGPAPPLTPPASAAADDKPRIVARSSSTLDPSMDVFAGDAVVSNPTRSDRPVAPPAFPSIPVGMAIKENQISQAAVDTVLEGVTPGAPRNKAVPAQIPQRLSAPLPEEPVAPRSKVPLILGIIVALSMLAGLAGVLLIILVGLVAAFL